MLTSSIVFTLMWTVNGFPRHKGKKAPQVSLSLVSPPQNLCPWVQAPGSGWWTEAKARWPCTSRHIERAAPQSLELTGKLQVWAFPLVHRPSFATPCQGACVSAQVCAHKTPAPHPPQGTAAPLGKPLVPAPQECKQMTQSRKVQRGPALSSPLDLTSSPRQ